MGQRYLNADVGEEDGGQQQVGQRRELALDVAALGRSRDDQAGGKRADDIGHAEHLFRRPCHEQAEHKRRHRESMQVPVLHAVVVPNIKLMGGNGHHARKHKEEHDFDQHHHNVCIAARHGGNQGQAHQAQHVVNEGRRQNGVARLCGQLADLTQRLHGNAHGGGGQHGAQEQAL